MNRLTELAEPAGMSRRQLLESLAAVVAGLGLARIAEADPAAENAAENQPLTPEQQAGKLVEQALAAVGGKDKLLRLFQIKETLAIGTGKGSTRTSILEPPDHWWLGKSQRAKPEPGLTAAWGWTLLPLVDPKSKWTLLPEGKIGEVTTASLKIEGSIDPAMNMHFDAQTHLLMQIDWPKPTDSYVFSDWKEIDGVKYAAKCSGQRNGKEWFHTEILEIERLTALPEGLTR